MAKILATLTDPTSDGIIVKVPCNQATLNNIPIATLGTMIQKHQGGMDAPAEFVQGVRLNNKPLTFVQAKTTGGSVIQSKGTVTACILDASEPTKMTPEEEQELETLTLESDYAYKQVEQLAEEVAQSTFTMLLEVFFDKTVPMIAYEQLYKDFSDKKKDKLNPPIKLVSYGGYFAAYNRKEKVIEITKSVVLAAIKGDELANARLLQGLLEEYGHYLDDVLRENYSAVGGDAALDEGAAFAYYFTNFNILKDTEIKFATATLNGNKTELKLDFSEFHDLIKEQTDRFSEDFRDSDREYFKSGKLNVNMGQYGHFDLEKQTFASRSGTQDAILSDFQLGFLYLGNYMRDMSQCITPSTTMYAKADLSKIEKFRGLKFLDPVKPGRGSWTLIIEILAAHSTIKEMQSESAEAMGGPGKDVFKPADPAKNKYLDKLKKISTSMGLKAVELAADYLLFIRHYGGFDESELGVYAPEQHIDNPLYAAAFDEKTNDLFCCPTPGGDVEQVHVPLGDKLGMQGIIRTMEGDTETGFSPISNSQGTGKYAQKGVGVPTALSYIEKELNIGVDKYQKGATQFEKNRGLIHLGNAFHVLEDYFAHTNFSEISLIKHGISVYPWVEPANFREKNYRVAETKESKGEEYLDFIPVKNSTQANIWPDVEEFFDGMGNLSQLRHLRIAGRGMFTFEGNNKNPDFGKKYPVKKAIYNAYFYNANTIGIRRGAGLRLTQNNEAYISFLPVVSGFFSVSDSIHSLSDVAKKLFESKEISFKSLMMDSDLSDSAQAALTLVDMLVIAWLMDIQLSQEEKGKNGRQTGVPKTPILEYYKEFIVFRSIVITVLVELKKRSPIMAFLVLFVQKVIDALYNALMNMVKNVIVNCLGLMEKGIVMSQNIESYRKLSSNPSHSQLAKDEGDHPLHGLAANLALEALSMNKENMKLLVNGEPVTGNDFLKKIKEAMVHPGHSDWMDKTVISWIDKNVHEIENLNKEEEFKARTEKAVRDVEEFIKEYEAKKKAVVESYEQLKAEIRQYAAKMRKAIEELKQGINQFKNISTKKLKELQKDIERISNEMMRSLDDSYQDLKQNYDELKNEMKSKLKEFDEELEKRMKEFTDKFTMNSDDRLRNYMNGINQEFKLPEDKNEYENRLYAYLTKTSDPIYKEDGVVIDRYLAMMDKLDNINNRYMKEDSKTMLARIKNSEKQNSFNSLA